MQLGIIYSREPRVDTDFLEKTKNKSGRGRCKRFAVNGPSIRNAGSLSLGSAGMTAPHSASVKPFASAPAHTNFAGPARPAGNVVRGNLQFSLPSLFSKPHVDFSLN
jgi:hypothetical protein